MVGYSGILEYLAAVFKAPVLIRRKGFWNQNPNDCSKLTSVVRTLDVIWLRICRMAMEMPWGKIPSPIGSLDPEDKGSR